jgi:hypothetical protein
MRGEYQMKKYYLIVPAYLIFLYCIPLLVDIKHSHNLIIGYVVFCLTGGILIGILVGKRLAFSKHNIS